VTLSITTFSIMTQYMMTLRIMTLSTMTQHNDAQHNSHNHDTQDNDTQHKDTQHNDTYNNTLPIYTRHNDQSLCWVSLYRMSWRPFLFFALRTLELFVYKNNYRSSLSLPLSLPLSSLSFSIVSIVFIWQMKGWVSKTEHAKDTGCLRCTEQIKEKKSIIQIIQIWKSVEVKSNRAQCHKTFYVRNIRMFVIS